jgi:hyperosmotically inducible protein
MTLNRFFELIVAGFALCTMTGCLLAAAGAGGGAGHIAAQNDRTEGETIDDQTIVASVKTALIADPEVPGLSVHVESYKGAVTLKGVLKDSETIDHAIGDARAVRGVKSVDSKLFVG